MGGDTRLFDGAASSAGPAFGGSSWMAMTSARVDQLTERLQQLLDAAADDRTRQYWERYLKGTARFRGVPMAAIRTAVRTLWHTEQLSGWPTPQLLALAQHWIGQPLSEDKLAGTLLIAEQLAGRLTLADGHVLARPLAEGKLADWSSCDWYATKALHAYLTANPQQLRPAPSWWPAGRRRPTCGSAAPPWSPSSSSPPSRRRRSPALSSCCWPPAPTTWSAPTGSPTPVPAGCYGSCHAAIPTRWHDSSRRTRSCRWRRPGWPPLGSAPDPTGGADPSVPAESRAAHRALRSAGDGRRCRAWLDEAPLTASLVPDWPEAHGGARWWWGEPFRVERRGQDLHAVH
jgi:hypothetical protein